MDAFFVGADLMGCPTLQTGNQFLSGLLHNIDCQARSIGTYGYGALAAPGSAASIVLTSLMTIFIALYGYRLLLGHRFAARDLVGDMVRVGLVLTLAASWPAWRILGYDVVLNGPVETAQSVGLASGLPGTQHDLIARLQKVDDAIVAATIYGTGRLTGGAVAGANLGDSLQGIALADQSALGYGRSAFLTGTIAPFALLRLGAGILLAVAPLIAGLALFAGTVGIFTGWWRGLAFCILGTFIQFLVQAVELALLEPWLTDVLARRAAGILTPSAPTELLALTLTFAIAALGLLTLSAWVVFHPSSLIRIVTVQQSARVARDDQARSFDTFQSGRDDVALQPSRAMLVAGSVAGAMRREAIDNSFYNAATQIPHSGRDMASPASGRREASVSDRLGSRLRRPGLRRSAAMSKRDQS